MSEFRCRGCDKTTVIEEPSQKVYDCSDCGADMIVWPEWSGSEALDLISAERRRQIEEEGWSPEHDKQWTDGEIAWAAICYAAPDRVYRERHVLRSIRFEDPWPWDRKWDKRGLRDDWQDPRIAYDQRRADLIKAGALIAAELDRLLEKGRPGIPF